MKNNNGRKTINIILIFLFAGLLCVPPLLYLICGDQIKKDAIESKQAFSQKYETAYRNGPGAKLSEWFAPSWYKNMEKDVAVEALEAESEPVTEPVIIETPCEDVDIMATKGIQGGYENILAGVPSQPADLPYMAPQESNNAIFGRDDWMFYSGENALPYYLGTNVLSEEEMYSFMDCFEYLDSLCEGIGVRLIVLVCPNKEQVYPELMPSYPIETEYKRLLTFEQFMHENSDVTFLYPLREMVPEKGKGLPLYFIQDTHWNDVGASVAAKAICKALGFPIKPFDEVTYEKSTHYGGDVADFVGASFTYPDYLISYRPEISLEREAWDATGEDLTSDIDQGIVRYTSSPHTTDRMLLMYGDSFRVKLVPILAKNFGEAWAFHRSYASWDLSIQALSSLKPGDVLVVQAVERYDVYNTYNANELADIISNLFYY